MCRESDGKSEVNFILKILVESTDKQWLGNEYANLVVFTEVCVNPNEVPVVLAEIKDVLNSFLDGRGYNVV